MPLGIKVGLSPDNFVLDRDPARPPQKGGGALQLSAHFYCGWMDHDATWYGGKPRLRPHCVRRGPSSPTEGAQQLPFFSAHVYCGPGRPSKLLLSSC